MSSNHVHQAVAEAAMVKGGGIAAVGGGFWAMFAGNAPEIGAMCAIIGATCTACSLGLNFYRTYKDYVGKERFEKELIDAAGDDDE